MAHKQKNKKKTENENLSSSEETVWALAREGSQGSTNRTAYKT